jgi:hypothetical protein
MAKVSDEENDRTKRNNSREYKERKVGICTVRKQKVCLKTVKKCLKEP